jgi:hypothetical protein
MRQRRTRIGGQFAPRLIEMLESPAYRVLSLSGRRVLDRVEIEMAHHGGTDNGRLPITYDDFEKYGMDRHAIAPSIREAVALGFLVVTVQGCAGNAEHRSPNLFRLTYRAAKSVNGDGSHEWRQIQSIEQAEAIARAARTTRATRTWRPTKKQIPVGVFPESQCGKPPLKTENPSGENPHYSHSGKTPTTIDISGRGRGKAKGASQGNGSAVLADPRCYGCRPVGVGL